MSADKAILVIALVLIPIVAVVTTAMRGIRRAQRIVVLIGTLAVAAQVFFPPCLGVGRPPSYNPEPAGRHLLPSSYNPIDSGYWIDGRQQTIELLVTVVMTAMVCVLILLWRRRIRPSQTPSAGPIP